ncbi:GNAT family N-acetyltransferase [Alsobacter sp. KACC 23698]|uniref:GNAT family N-acetyltransferase n=1 Tax=Alsobacter sp. KACC 23698 TaxID=3149229 RepID=A0AAU7JLI6_9HYPH
MSVRHSTLITPASSDADMDAVRALFGEYIASLGVDLAFQGVEAELAGLPGPYAPPRGALLIARTGEGEPVGCVGLRPLREQGVCEIKRLYVRPQARGQDLGRRLALAVIAAARAAGFARMRLDTLAPMRSAQALYASLGFQPTPAYYDNPLPGTQYMALDLDGTLQSS